MSQNRMRPYLELVIGVMREGVYKRNRTGVDTIADFSRQVSIDLRNGFPLLTTKNMDGHRWNSIVHELLWYISGQEHIRDLTEETSIWDAWADENGLLDTAYGRFWRRFPMPAQKLDGEAWPGEKHKWVNESEPTFDQLQYVLDQLRENPNSRRIVLNAWHPANAAVSSLPPCHYTAVFNVQNGKLNLHLTQRSGDIALGIPFNIAAYALLAKLICHETAHDIGKFSHTIVDAHIYCGKENRGQWYQKNLSSLQTRLENVEEKEQYLKIRDWIKQNAPPEGTVGYDHVPNLLTQLSRKPRDRPSIHIDQKSLDQIRIDDIHLRDYSCADELEFRVAE